MKKYFAIFLVVALTLTSFAGCAKKADTDETTAAKPITITLAHVEQPETTLGRACTAFKEYVEKESDGQLLVNILPNGQIGGDKEAAEGCALGSIQMTPCVTSVLTEYSDNYMILDLPFMFKDRQASYDALDGDLGTELNKDLTPVGLTNLGYNDNGLRQITNNVRPITKPADLKGVKMRVMESPVYVRMFELLGANPVPMSFTEVYTALQQGTVDGQENGMSLIYDSKFQEVVKYLSITNHVYSINACVINSKFYEGLTADQQKIIADGVKIKLVDYERELEGNADADSLQKLKDAGMVVNEVTPENMQLFRDAVKPMYAEYKGTDKGQIAPALFDLVDKYNAASK